MVIKHVLRKLQPRSVSTPVAFNSLVMLIREVMSAFPSSYTKQPFTLGTDIIIIRGSRTR